MRAFRLVPAACALAAGVSAVGVARADDDPPGASTSHGDVTVTAPPGSGGLTVVTPYPGGGQVVASGCSQVTVNGAPTWITASGAPCPQYAPYQPYSSPPRIDERVRWAPDGERTGALIASSIVFGVGGAVAGLAYVIQYENDDGKCTAYSSGVDTLTPSRASCNHASARTSLVTYGAIVGVTPSIPRWTVGDIKGGLIFAGLRVASVAAAALVPWGDGDGKWTGAFLFGFAAPVALGIVDLATAPHREELDEDGKAARITSVAPVALADRNGAHGAMIALGGRF
jgi:hypothetical protein